ncbi:exodeoxyribonuclease III [Haliangium ochraceum]|uniref:exodeoxyribonuclease III n=1 Tax=Haliangium ochraceum TaxID=80816 RepID=UPI001E4739D2|nr:exodeoxyribonuclease III [Haliangium ochraceum]
MRVVSWNVNGLRAVDRTTPRRASAAASPSPGQVRASTGARAQRGGGRFRRWIERVDATIVGVQEVRARRDALPRRLLQPRGWHAHLVEAERAGYSGVGLYAKLAPDGADTALAGGDFDREGRLQIAHFGRLSVANVYFPNGNGSNRDNSRVPFKLDFYRALFDALGALRDAGQRVLVMGDFNTAHRDIDLARPKQNRKTSGFLPEERAELDRWVAAGWVDTFRHFEPGPGHYTWWSQRAGVRARNIGWRIDYVFACPEAMPFVRSAFLMPQVGGSDHCPHGVVLDPAITRAAPPLPS